MLLWLQWGVTPPQISSRQLRPQQLESWSSFRRIHIEMSHEIVAEIHEFFDLFCCFFQMEEQLDHRLIDRTKAIKIEYHIYQLYKQTF